MADGMKISRFRQYNGWYLSADCQLAGRTVLWSVLFFSLSRFRFPGGYCTLFFSWTCFSVWREQKKNFFVIKFYIIFHKFSVFIFSVISRFSWEMRNCFISQSNKTYYHFERIINNIFFMAGFRKNWEHLNWLQDVLIQQWHSTE